MHEICIIVPIVYITLGERNKFRKEENLTINLKVRGHCPFTGDYGGAAHNICNLRHAITREAPLIMHNGTNYDFHAVMKNLVK